MKSLWLSFIILLISSDLEAKSFGVVGETFPVAELSFLQLIEERLAALSSSGQLNWLNQQWMKNIVSHTDRPYSLGLSRTLKTKSHVYKPEIVLQQAITDIQGRVLFPQGFRVNALEQLPAYSPCWLFFDADDKAQISWAQKEFSHCINYKLILTGGSVSRAEKVLQTVIYFDQASRITKKLHISSVPARVKRQDNLLKIEELAIKENGDVL